MPKAKPSPLEIEIRGDEEHWELVEKLRAVSVYAQGIEERLSKLESAKPA